MNIMHFFRKMSSDVGGFVGFLGQLIRFEDVAS